MSKWMGVVAVVLGISASAFGQFDLQITEMWPGNEPGDNLSEDWFEVTNVGNVAWTDTVGTLYFDDESADTVDAKPLSGISLIAPGESVVFVDEDDSVAWSDLWDDVITLPQVGDYDGKGLGQGGDGVALYLDTDNDLVSGDLIDYETYPDADNNGGQSWDVGLGAFSVVGNAAGAVATTTLNDEDQPAIGSPGAIPEPATMALLGLGGLAVIRRRRNG